MLPLSPATRSYLIGPAIYGSLLTKICGRIHPEFAITQFPLNLSFGINGFNIKMVLSYGTPVIKMSRELE